MADSTNVWTYRLEQHQYTKTAVAAEGSSSTVMTIPDISRMRAEKRPQRTCRPSYPFKSATSLPDATILINGDPIPCYVVLVQTGDISQCLVQTGPASVLKVLLSENQLFTAIEGAP